jgi:hypothetical protein
MGARAYPQPGKPLSYGNLLFFGLLGVMIIGKQILLSASQPKRRVQVQLERLEEAQWRNSMQNGAATQLNANQIGQINFISSLCRRPLAVIGGSGHWVLLVCLLLAVMSSHFGQIHRNGLTRQRYILSNVFFKRRRGDSSCYPKHHGARQKNRHGVERKGQDR